MSLVEEVRSQAALLSPLPTELNPDPIQRLQSQANFALTLLADLNPAAAAKVREYAIAFAVYRETELEKIYGLAKPPATMQGVADRLTEVSADFRELVILHSKICDVAPGSRIAEEAWRCATYAKGLLTIHSNTLKEFNER
jgi:hypothetical protein